MPKARPKFSRKGAFVQAYDPQSSIKQNVQKIMYEKIQQSFNSENKSILSEASELTKADSFKVTLTFYIPPSRFDLQGVKNCKIWGIQKHHSKPDLDNLEKFYLDCANGILFDDDRRISKLSSTKMYSDNPRTVIDIMPRNNISLSEKARNILKSFSPTLFQEFLDDVEQFKKIYQAALQEDQGDSTQQFITSTSASFLAMISRKYGKEFNKVKKFNDFQLKDAEHDDSQTDLFEELSDQEVKICVDE